ncbi:MAG: peptidyl-tRNA hydrolase Pth2 [Candidatus Nanohaloarchaea archaeon]
MKQVIVLRSDLDMSEGKKISQACHASLGAYRNADDSVSNRWEAEGATKITVKVEGERELEERFKEARADKIPAYLVKDAGETELESGTVTALGLGPAPESKLDRITSDLELV